MITLLQKVSRFKSKDFLIEKSVFVLPEYSLHEGIQKYNHYFVGWDDAVDSVKIVEKSQKWK